MLRLSFRNQLSILLFGAAVFLPSAVPGAVSQPRGAGQILGSVVTEAGEPVPHVSVAAFVSQSSFQEALTALRPDGEQTTEATFEEDSRTFRVDLPAPDFYDVVVTAPGYVPSVLRKIPLTNNLLLPELRLGMDVSCQIEVRVPDDLPTPELLWVSYPTWWQRQPGWTAWRRPGFRQFHSLIEIPRASGESVDVVLDAEGFRYAQSHCGESVELRRHVGAVHSLQLFVETAKGNTPRPEPSVMLRALESLRPLGVSGVGGEEVRARSPNGVLAERSVGVLGKPQERSLSDSVAQFIVPAGGRSVVRGCVSAAGSGKPSSDVLISLTTADAPHLWYRGTVDELGCFHFVVGNASVLLEAFAALFDYQLVALSPSDLHSGEWTGTIRLDQSAILRGVVQRADGSPIEAAEVRPLGRRQLLIAPFARTDAEGKFELPWADGDQLLLEFHHPGFERTVRSVALSESSITVVLRPLHTLAVMVTDEAGQPIRGASVAAAKKGAALGLPPNPLAWPGSRLETQGVTTTDERGMARLALTFRKEGLDVVSMRRGFALTTVPVGPDSGSSVHVVMAPEAVVGGTVRDSHGTRVAHGKVRFGRYTGRRMGGTTKVYDHPGEVSVEDGTFLINGFREGDVIDVFITAPAFVETREEGVVAPALLDLEVLGGGELQLEVVTDRGEPISKALVSIAAASFGEQPRVARTDPQGRVAFDSLPPRQSVVEVSHPLFHSVAQNIRLHEGVVARQIQLKAAQQKVVGTVRRRNEVLPGVVISVDGIAGTQTDNTGYFERGITQGRHRVEAADPRTGEQLCRTVDVQRDVEEVDLSFDPVRLSVTVVDPGRTPLPEVDVVVRQLLSGERNVVPTDVAGIAALDLLPCDYEIRARVGAADGTRNLVITGQQSWQEETIVVEPRGSLVVRVRHEGVTGLQASLRRDPLDRVVPMHRVDDWTFEARNLTPERWIIEIGTKDDVLAVEEVYLSRTELNKEMTMDLDDDLYQVDGRLSVEGVPISGIEIFMIPGERLEAARNARTTALGDFTVRGLKSAEYLFVASGFVGEISVPTTAVVALDLRRGTLHLTVDTDDDRESCFVEAYPAILARSLALELGSLIKRPASAAEGVDLALLEGSYTVAIACGAWAEETTLAAVPGSVVSHVFVPPR